LIAELKYQNLIKKNIIYFNNFPNGRLANAAFEFLYAKYLEKLGFKVIIGAPNHPPEVDIFWKLFDLPNNNHYFSVEHSIFLGEERAFGPEISIQKIKEHFKNYPGSILCIDGYFQFDTNKILEDSDYFMTFETNLGLNFEPTNTFQKIIGTYKKKIESNYLVTIHVRRGDYLYFVKSGDWREKVFYVLNLDNVLEKLQKYITSNRIKNLVVYIASDDIDFCKNYFTSKNIKILTSEDFIERRVDNPLMVDLAAMTAANMLIASNSSLSILGAMINNRGKVFWREDIHGELTSFDPWSTPILYGPLPC